MESMEQKRKSNFSDRVPSRKRSDHPPITNITLTLHSQEFAEVAKRIDSFYTDTANTNVTIHGAIEIALMQMRNAPSESVTKKLELERTRIVWGF